MPEDINFTKKEERFRPGIDDLESALDEAEKGLDNQIHIDDTQKSVVNENPVVVQEKIDELKNEIAESLKSETGVDGAKTEAVVGRNEEIADKFFESLVENASTATSKESFRYILNAYKNFKLSFDELRRDFKLRTGHVPSLENVRNVKYKPKENRKGLFRFVKFGDSSSAFESGIPLAYGKLDDSRRVEIFKKLGFDGDFQQIINEHYNKGRGFFSRVNPNKGNYNILIENNNQVPIGTPEFDIRMKHKRGYIFPEIYLIPKTGRGTDNFVDEMFKRDV